MSRNETRKTILDYFQEDVKSLSLVCNCGGFSYTLVDGEWREDPYPPCPTHGPPTLPILSRFTDK